ncbi:MULTISPECIES: PTS sugar transporter subunit IIA [Atopobiaceae]|jgi:PTS system galactitol-specific IIA component|uniref:PTS sugar transporter subunit IIA n=1 Tax=Tractidigestivibacter montrealensis TaxID=2972466 RepID=A0ABT1Z5C0_9ACTN|nr:MULTISPECIES: PTS sugar transporter subunit IIA [Atopobiaceae]MCR9035409.1 PTS sugar transporter subunit IIA [Tractidigestivibacter montrealensis]RGS51389.1 PTS sugar transporter subunit IIA [Olsenella sp. AF21-51]RHK02783.1 PTS sugar transporter subunit IIA [Olsenella sp. AM04-33]
MVLNLFPEDILLNIDAESCQEVLHLVSTHLFGEGKVKQSYEEHLIDREREYPTGLALGDINVAIPHTDYQYANTTQLLVATLKKPVEWHNMEDSDESIPVSVVVLSVFDKPEHQLEALQKIMGVLQNQELVAQIADADSAQQVIELFN